MSYLASAHNHDTVGYKNNLNLACLYGCITGKP